METKTFTARTILTVTTGRLLTEAKGPNDNGISDLYEILGWMTDDQPFTHQLGRFGEECKPWLLKWFPELEIAGSVQNIARLDELGENAKERGESYESALLMWLEWMGEPGMANLQDSYDVPRIPKDEHLQVNPIDELVGMFGGKADIAVISMPS